MINQWLEASEKRAVIYNADSYTYNEIIEASKKLDISESVYDGVLCCWGEDVFIQLLAVIRGLNDNMPVYFGKEEALYERDEECDLENIFLIATSSGTTGRKKFIYKRASQWLESFEAYSETFDIKERDVLFLNGSLSYTANLYSALHILHTGGTILLSKDKNPKKWIELIETYEASISYLVPSKLRLLSKVFTAPWQHRIEITTAGEALAPAVLSKLYAVCPNVKIHHYYGAAELGHISAISHEELLIRPTSVGRAFKGVDIRIRQGVIYGSSLYSLSAGKQYDSAYDYGVLDEDGYLYVTGRKDTQINVHGRKFDTMDVIKQLRRIQGVEDILFIAPKNDDPLKGKSYHLYVVAEASTSRECLENELKTYLLENTPQWQWPKQMQVVPNGIYSETGKYDIVKIGELFQ